jgi:hypothetical protein
MPPKLWKYYLRASLIPMIGSVLATAGWLIYDHRWGSLGNFTREQLGGNELDIVLILVALGNGVVMAALGTLIFLNGYPKIRSNPLLSLLTWSILPMIWLLYIGTMVDADELETILLVLCVTLPYLISNPWTFAHYRRSLNATASGSTAADPGYPPPSSPAAPGAPEY